MMRTLDRMARACLLQQSSLESIAAERQSSAFDSGGQYCPEAFHLGPVNLLSASEV